MISIPNPCHEDFNKMTPTEKGAYCKVCSTDTYDFRNLSNEQIFQIMEDNQGEHVCGRFTKAQLENLNMPAYYAWKNQSARTFQSKFLLACLLVFGLGLFSCSDEEKDTLNEIKVEQVLQDVEPQIGFINGHIDPEITNIDLLDYVEEPEQPICEIQGELAYEYYDQYETAGIVAYDEPVDDYVLGGAVVMTEYNIIETTMITNEDSTEKSTLANHLEIDPSIFEAKAYPNPTQGLSTVAIEVEKEGQFDINMYNMNGQLVTSIHSGHLYSGRQLFEIDLQDLNSGMYIVKVISQGQDETLKIQKVN